MGLFKSNEERRLERNMKVRQALSHLRRQVKATEKHQVDFIAKAKHARRIGSATQYEFLKKNIKKSATVRVRLERQLLSLETASQIKDQAEGHAQFASAMNALSKSIAEAFGVADLAKTQVNFEKAMAQASNLEERMDVFLETSSESMFDYEGAGEGDLVTDAEIDKLLEEEVTHDERVGTDVDLDADIKSIEKELERGRR